MSDFINLINLQAKRDSSLWKKSNKYLSPNCLTFNQESEKQHESKKSKNSKKH